MASAGDIADLSSTVARDSGLSSHPETASAISIPPPSASTSTTLASAFGSNLVAYGPSRSSTRLGGSSLRSLSSPRPITTSLSAGPDEASSAATSPAASSHMRSAASTRPSSFEVLRSGKGSLEPLVPRSPATVFEGLHTEPRLPGSAPPKPLFKVRSADHRGQVEWSRAGETVREGKARAKWEVDGHSGPGEGGVMGSQRREIGRGIIRSARSGSIAALASSPALSSLGEYHLSDLDVGPLDMPLQHRGNARFHGLGADTASSSVTKYPRKLLQGELSPRLRKVVSSAAALTSGESAAAGQGRTDGLLWVGPPESASQSLALGERQHAPSRPTDDSAGYAPSEDHSEGESQVVRHTTQLSTRRDERGRWIINSYIKGKEIGRGVHGVVYLGKDTNRLVPWVASSTSDAEAERTEDYATVAIKVVRREPRNKSLRRSQAHRQAAREAGNDYPGLRGQLLQDVDDKLKREIAIMKRVKHDHIVRLYEVIDDIKSKRVFMILEFMEGGQIKWQDPGGQTPLLTVEQTRSTFRQVVLGLEYLHYQGIIHRDIKPANLLWAADRQTIKISDFGVSHLSSALKQTASSQNLPSGLDAATATRPPPATTASDDRALRKTEGSPAFMAPELCCPMEPTPKATPSERTAIDYFTQKSSGLRRGGSPAESFSSARTSGRLVSFPLPRQPNSHKIERPTVGKAIDIWALGVTLYCLLFGRTPFSATNEFELFNVIWNEPAVVPELMGAERLSTRFGPVPEQDNPLERDARSLVDLLGKLLEKDPRLRIRMDEVKRHPWVLSSLERPRHWVDETALAEEDAIVVTQDDLANFMQPRSTTPTLARPLAGVRESLRKAAIRLGLRSNDERRPERARTKSVSSASASACASPLDAQEETLPLALSRQTSRAASVYRNGSWRATRTPSPSRSPASNTSLGKHSFLSRGWASHRATPQQSRCNIGAGPVQLTAEDLFRSASASSTTSSGAGTPLNRSRSGQNLNTTLHSNSSVRSVPPTPLLGHPHSSAVAQLEKARGMSPSPASEGEARHGFISRVREKFARRKIPQDSFREASAASDDGPMGTIYGFGAVSSDGQSLPDTSRAVLRDEELRTASRNTSRDATNEVLYASSDDEVDSMSDLDDDGDDDLLMTVSGGRQEPIMYHDGKTLHIGRHAPHLENPAFLTPGQTFDGAAGTIAARRFSNACSSSGERDRTSNQAVVTDTESSNCTAQPVTGGDENSEKEPGEGGGGYTSSVSQRRRSMQSSYSRKSAKVSGDGGRANCVEVVETARAGADEVALEVDVKSRRRRATLSQADEAPPET